MGRSPGVVANTFHWQVPQRLCCLLYGHNWIPLSAQSWGKCSSNSQGLGHVLKTVALFSEALIAVDSSF